ncbi:MAG: adenylyl-sulfate kinase [Blastocatellia bacterium]|nr:MAG: adenylyl-sulfate kinase [Blastocatellia bacterium]
MKLAAGLTLWFTGLSGAGKSTLAGRVGAVLTERGHRVEILDGDDIRRNLSSGLGFSKDDRDANIRRIGFVARLLSRNGIVAITAAISPYRAVREEVRREHEATFIEVFVDCSLEEAMRRDTKGLYARALRGELPNFTGISDPYEPPIHAEVTVQTDREQVEESVSRILAYLEKNGLVNVGPVQDGPLSRLENHTGRRLNAIDDLERDAIAGPLPDSLK